MNVNDIVIVIEAKSLPKHWKGRYGRIVEIFGEKAVVEFYAAVGHSGNLAHTVNLNELKVVGKALQEVSA